MGGASAQSGGGPCLCVWRAHPPQKEGDAVLSSLPKHVTGQPGRVSSLVLSAGSQGGTPGAGPAVLELGTSPGRECWASTGYSKRSQERESVGQRGSPCLSFVTNTACYGSGSHLSLEYKVPRTPHGLEVERKSPALHPSAPCAVLAKPCSLWQPFLSPLCNGVTTLHVQFIILMAAS